MAQNFDTAKEFKLENPPNDCIQSLKFGDSQHLLAASWDCTVRLYDIRSNHVKIQYPHEAPVLDAAFQGTDICWSGGLDNRVKRFDIESQTESVVGSHEDAVRCVEFVPETNLIATGSWDSHLKFWDPRLSAPSIDHLLPSKIYAMSVCGHRLIVGLSSRRVVIYDLRNMTQVQRESLLKYQIRDIQSFPDKRGYVVSSIEGRVAVEYLDPAPERGYAFKCHRQKEPATGLELVYPVNAISFSRFNTFATGGSDGFVSIWDPKNKKRLVQFRRYPLPISSLSFSPDGATLAIACSNINATEDAPPDSIIIRMNH